MKHKILLAISFLVLSFSVFAQSENSVCPSISVSGGGVLQKGEPTFFTASVSESAKDLKLEYVWTVSSGKIIEGQGTPTIKVDTTDLDGFNLTATVEIKGLPENCPNKMSETGSWCQPYLPILIDEFGKLSSNEIGARMDDLFLKLIENPTAQGYIINYGTYKEIIARERQIINAVKVRKFDSSRITIVRGGQHPNGAGVLTKIYVVPPGADVPQP